MFLQGFCWVLFSFFFFSSPLLQPKEPTFPCALVYFPIFNPRMGHCGVSSWDHSPCPQRGHGYPYLLCMGSKSSMERQAASTGAGKINRAIKKLVQLLPVLPTVSPCSQSSTEQCRTWVVGGLRVFPAPCPLPP